MPVDLVIYLPSLEGGGAERAMLDLAQGLSSHGVRVELVLARAEGAYLEQVPEGLPVVDLGAARVLASLPALVRHLRQRKPEVVFSTLSHANIVALWAQKLARVPTRVVVRQANTSGVGKGRRVSLKGALYRALLRRSYRRAHAVVAVSEGVASDLARLVGIPRERIQVMHNPVVTPELLSMSEAPLDHPWFAVEEPPVVLGVGRLTAQKDFPTLLQAFARVRAQRQARLVLLGKGEDEGALRALAVELGVEEDVDMPGFVANPFSFMRRAAVFVLSSRWEGLPNALIQALALGTPVVATDCPSGPREILEGGRWGRLVPVGDVGEMAQAILAAIDEPPASPEVRAQATERFGLEAVVEEYMKVLGLR